MVKPTAVVGTSGGPTAVINASTLGVIDGAKSSKDIGKVVVAQDGILGILTERLIDIAQQSRIQLSRLRHTPAAAFGSCRYKLKDNQERDFDRIIEVFKAHNVRYFFYAGGNDSMLTIDRINELAKERGHDLIAVGVPKTIDNDVVGEYNNLKNRFEVIDHLPGYPSTALYWIIKMYQWDEENRTSCSNDPVLIGQGMGRKIGFITAAAEYAIRKKDIPAVLALHESNISLEKLYEEVVDVVKQAGRCIVIVNEGFNAGEVNEVVDAFKHVEYGKTLPAAYLVTEFINKRGLPSGKKARFQIPGTDQRDDHTLVTQVDVDEAYKSGLHAVEVALKHGTGYMVTIERESKRPYKVKFGHDLLRRFAGYEAKFPEAFIDGASRVRASDAFVEWVTPLVRGGPVQVPFKNGLPVFAKIDLTRRLETKLDPYQPQEFKKYMPVDR